MALEIERKFTVQADKLPVLELGTPIIQGYIPTTNGATVRVRLAGENAFLCIKTLANNCSRHEFEFAVPVEDARDMLDKVCHYKIIEKSRYLVMENGQQWEVDVFHGDNTGLIVAELELDSEQQEIIFPDWIDKDVTNDQRYSNYALAFNPYPTWS